MSNATDSDLLAGGVRAVLAEAWAEPDVVLDGFTPFGDGHSGETYRAALHARRFAGDVVIRVSPAGVAISGPADVGRQGRIMGALNAAGAPAPAVVFAESAPVVDGRAVAIMELVSGENWESFLSSSSPSATAQAAVDALHAIQAVPIAGTAIGDTAPFGLIEEVDRWSVLLSRCPEEIRPAASRLREHLGTRLPEGDTAPVLAHGDFHYGNLLFGRDRVLAVLDWEIAALGHPLTDLACLAVASLRRRYRPDPNPTGGIDISLAELAQRYGARPDDMAWHTSAACLKYAAIIGYNLTLHRRGKRDDPIYESLQHTMHRLLEDGTSLLDHGLGEL